MTYEAPVPIAIIGIGCRFPGNVTDTETLWDLLVEGRNSWGPVPTERYNEAAFYHPKPDNNGTTNHRGGHFLGQDIAAFDAAFFGISPLEAQAMDPQQRLLLEVSYEAFEDAGIPMENVHGSDTAVYVAMFTRDYDRNIYKDTSDIPKYHVTGSGEAIASNRISYIFNLKGPSMTLDTGCSGSMVALHQACQSLRTGESSMALASGVSLMISPDHMISMSNLGMLNGDGRSYSFDARGSGYGRGEGASVVLLKRLDDAVQAGDEVRAIIRNSATNQDGKTNGITLPSQEAQECLERSIYKMACLDPHEIPYIETHGTGTSAGDLAELQGIANVFCGNMRHQSKLYVGSIKSNIGHLESSSGLAGLIKTVVILEKGSIPPNADFQTKKQSLKLEEWNMEVPTKLEPWPIKGGKRQASVNSFGYGGTNAHVILESAPSSLLLSQSEEEVGSEIIPNAHIWEQFGRSQTKAAKIRDIPSAHDPPSKDRDSPLGPRLFVLSARSEHSILQLVAKFKKWAGARPDFENYFEDLAYTLSSRRSMMQWRYSFVARSHLEMVASLDQKSLWTTKKASDDLRVAFVFTGQGAQWFAMGRELINTQSQFAASLIKSDIILRDLGSGWSLLDELRLDENDSRIHEGEIAQPASTALQIALVDLLASIGIKPRMVLGHSSGEIAAAYASGILSHDVALRVSYCRSLIPSTCRHSIPTKGAMISVGLGEEEVSDLIADLQRGIVSVACVNSPHNTTISGDEPAILEIEETLNRLGVFNRKLKVDTAYHSHHMQRVAQQYSSSLGSIRPQSRREGVTFMSSVTAKEKTQDFGAAYWVENLVSKVRFCDALQEFCRMQIAESQNMRVQQTHLIVEIGPHSVLGGPIQQTISLDFESFDYVYLRTLARGRAAVDSVLEMVGKMFERGYPVDLVKANSLSFSKIQPRLIRCLPTYPWDHSNTYWHESRLSRDHRLRQNAPHDLLGVRIPSSTPLEPSWRHIISIDTLPWLEEHVIDGLAVFPGSGYLCMAIEALRQLTSSSQPHRAINNFVLQQISFSKALVVPPAPLKIEMLINLRIQKSVEATCYEFRIFAILQDGVWHEHCSGLIMADLVTESSPDKEFVVDRKQGSAPTRDALISTMLAGCSRHLRSKDMYNELCSSGNFYGPMFAAISELSIGERQAVGHIRIPDVQSIMPLSYQQPHIIHPTTLDAVMHTALPVYAQHHGPGSVMPVSIQEIILSASIPRAAGEELLAATSISSSGIASARSDVFVSAGRGEIDERVMTISQVDLRGLEPSEAVEIGSTKWQNVVYQMKYAPDVDFVLEDDNEGPVSLSIADYLALLGFKYSQLVVLEIGAGTGHTTCQIISCLMNDGSTPIARYDFTDVTGKSFQQARDLLQDWHTLMRFQTLNAQQDPLEQGFEGCSYDLIIATDIYMSDSHFDNTMANIRKLLKPGGRLILNTSEDCTTDGGIPHHALLRSSIGDAQFCHDGMSDSARTGKMIVSQCVDPDTQTLLDPIMIVADEGLETFASLLNSALIDQAFESGLTTWASYDPTYQAISIVLDNGQSPHLSNLTLERFGKVVKLLGARSKVFWIIAQEDATTGMNPERGLLTGLARSARAENEDLRIITLDVHDAIGKCMPHLITKIIDVLSVALCSSVQSHQSLEVEYAYRDGQILIPRLIVNKKINTWVSHATTRSIVRSPYLHSQNLLKLCMDTIASLENHCFVDDDSARPSLNESVIEIAVSVHSLNSVEVRNLSTGIRDAEPVMHEFAGTVSAVGPNAGEKFQVGDRVCAWTFDGVQLPSRARVDMDSVARLPESTSLAVGATLSVALMAAYYALYELAHLRQGQTLLIHGADSDIGQAALVIAHHKGADIFATASNAAAREIVAKRYQIPWTRVFATSDPALKQRIFDCTDGHGVNMVLNTLSRDSISNLWACIAVLGTFIQIGNPWNPATRTDTWPFTDKNAIIMTFDLPSLIRDRPQEAVGLLGKAVAILEHGDLMACHSAPEISMSDVEYAFRKLRALKQFEKVILVADETTQVNALSINTDALQTRKPELDANATYVVAGGLGDLGREICRLMACRGAKTIVVLSRRALGEFEQQAFERRLQLSSPGLRIFSMACDISKRSMVDEVLSSFMSHLPPVKGIIQSAAVLQDGVLEGMTLDDFQVPLQTKMYGTRHLSEALEDSPLDFFIMLSSLSGVVGSRGQANYAAGNTFQDALAHYHTASKTHYMALDLGMIEGTDAYRDRMGRARVTNLVRQGWVPVKHDELLAIVDYAMSPQARNDSCHQAAIGIDGRSIHEADNATPTMKSAIFTHIRGSYNSMSLTENPSANTRVREHILAATSAAEVSKVINSAISQRLSSITMLDIDSIDLETPLLDYGLDSLTAAELKNWIFKELEAPVQASEILDESSIRSLGIKVVSRSRLIKRSASENLQQETVNGGEQPQAADCNLSQMPFPNDGPNQKTLLVELPPLPLPGLKDSLDLYLMSSRPFLSEDEFGNTSLAIRAFQEGFGQTLQSRLLERSKDRQIDNWQHDLHVRGIYLERRDPVHPYGTFYSSHLLTDPPHSQVERAAVISAAAYDFKQRLDADNLEQDYLNGEPICMESLTWLFNTARQPGIGIDKVCKYPGNNYLVALRRGHVFKIMLEEDGRGTSYLNLKHKFQAVIEHSMEKRHSLATLSADERDSWAKIQESITSLSPKTNALINMMNAAAFIVCLDEGSPATPTERCNQFLLGDPSNRWSDKCLQFIICENGVSGYVCEHSMLDAASLKQMNQSITRAILEHNVGIHKDGHINGHGDSVDEVTLTTNTSILDHIERVQREFDKRYNPAEFSHFRLSAVGNVLLHTHKIPAKAGIQLIIQLASLLYFGKQYPSWETVTMMPFHRGRLDWMQVVSPNMYSFCKAAADDRTPIADRLRLLRDAAQSHASTLTKIARGRGFAAHLEALQETVREHEPVPALFRDPTWEMMRVTSTRKIKTDASEGLMAQEAGFFMPDSESVFVHYEVEDDGCIFFIQSTKGRTLPFCEALRTAEDIVKRILQM